MTAEVKLSEVRSNMKDIELSIDQIDLEIKNIEQDISQINPRKLLKKWVE